MYTIRQGTAVAERRGAVVKHLKVGHAFGAAAVLGIHALQSSSVRAETVCDLQVLSLQDLDLILNDFPEERAQLMRVMAGVMRQELAEVTDLDILLEAPLKQ